MGGMAQQKLARLTTRCQYRRGGWGMPSATLMPQSMPLFIVTKHAALLHASQCANDDQPILTGFTRSAYSSSALIPINRNATAYATGSARATSTGPGSGRCRKRAI